jgi:sugar phosphate isomerase/epimerase
MMAEQARVRRFGFSSVQARDLGDLDERLARIKASGAEACELSICGADLICGGRIVRKNVEKLQAICARHDLHYTVHGPLSADLMDRARLDWHEAAVASMLEISGLVGASVMVHHTGRPAMASAGEIDRLHALERDRMKALGDVAGKHGVTIAVENLWVASSRFYTASPARLAEEIERIDHPHVAGTLDISHAFLHTAWLGQDFETAVRTFAPVACHIHGHDSFGRPGDFGRFPSEQLAFGIGDLHLPLGWGAIPWKTLLPKLAVRDGTIFMIELPPHFWSELEDCARTAKELIPLIGRDHA